MIHISYKKILVLALVVGSLVSFSSGTTVSASTFNAGRIIDDGVFTDKSTMNPSQIQDFLNAKVPRCDTWGEQPYAGTTRAQYAASRGVSTPFTCLKDYTQDGKRASQIIYDVAQKYSINPQVLIVLLQKEQGLITDDWPWPIQYRSATGYGCPDTADCSAQYYGFTNQVDWAARMFRAILNDSPDWYTPYELGNNFIQYSPDASCGGSTVNIQNRSTQALYNYTPYQPNQAALDAGWGTAPCGAYGNRNFHLYFTGWFGNTFAQFGSLSSPRWMQLRTTTQKIDPYTGQAVDGSLEAGKQLKFLTKINTAKGTCLRTEHDTNANINKCIPLSDITELNITYQTVTESEKIQAANRYVFKQNLRTNKSITAFPIEQNQQIEIASKTSVGGITYYVTKTDAGLQAENGIPATSLYVSQSFQAIPSIWKKIAQDTSKKVPSTGSNSGGGIKSGIILEINSRTATNGVTYYRTAHDTYQGFDRGFIEADLEDPFESFMSPRWMRINKDTSFIHPFTAEKGAAINNESQLYLTSKVIYNGRTYYRAEAQSTSGSMQSIRADDVSEINFEAFANPRWLQTARDTPPYDPVTGSTVGGIETAGSQHLFTSKIYVNNEWYYRTKAQTNAGLRHGYKSSDLSEILYVDFLQPRELRLLDDARKSYPATGELVDGILPRGMIRTYDSKIQINGKWFYRTSNDTDLDINKAIEASLLGEL